MASDNLSRRRVLKGTAGIAGATTIAGCLGGSGGGSGSDGGDLPYEVTGPYRLRMWHEKYGNQRIQTFAEEHGIEASNKGFSSPADPYSTIQAGQYAGDNISFLHNWGQRAWENDLLEPIDTSQLQHLDQLDSRWRTMNEVGEDEQWGIPYDVGIFPLTYNTDEISSAPTSWDVLWDSAYEGQITMQDSAITACQIAALYTGQDPISPDDFDDIEAALMQQKPLIRAYWGTFERGMRLFVDESVVVGQLTVGRTVQAAVEHGSNVDYTVPDEGGMTYFDEFTIPHNAENTGTTLAWIDDYLANGGGLFTELEKYRSTVRDLDAKMPDELKGWFEWPQDWDLIPQELLADDVRNRYDEIWTNVKG